MQPLLIPIADRVGNPIPEFGNLDTKFYSANSTLLATGYTRIVVGERGAYIEFAPENICIGDLHLPPNEKWRLGSEVAYYIEHRSRDVANVKVHEQRRTLLQQKSLCKESPEFCNPYFSSHNLCNWRHKFLCSLLRSCC